MLKFTLGWPPSINEYRRAVVIGGRARALMSQKARTFREAAVEALQMHQVSTITDPVTIQIDLYPPTKRAFDVDNFAKGILDALQHAGVLEDDSLVHKLVLVKHEKDPPGRADVSITQAEG